jgi:hypothetical protein
MGGRLEGGHDSILAQLTYFDAGSGAGLSDKVLR